MILYDHNAYNAFCRKLRKNSLAPEYRRARMGALSIPLMHTFDRWTWNRWFLSRLAAKSSLRSLLMQGTRTERRTAITKLLSRQLSGCEGMSPPSRPSSFVVNTTLSPAGSMKTRAGKRVVSMD